VRTDIGVVAGSEVGIHYDSMLGKIIASAPTRSEAAQILRRALAETWLPGLVTNREQLVRILAHPAFLAGELDTHFLERHAGDLGSRMPGLDRVRVAAIALVLAGIAARRRDDALAPPGWRNVPYADQTATYTLGDAEVIVGYRPAGAAVDFAIGGKTMRVDAFGVDGDRVWFVEHGRHRRTARVCVRGARAWVQSEGALLAFVEQPRFPDAAARSVAGALVAPMPGKVLKVLVTIGQEVTAGTPLVVLEAMKMEHTVRAPVAGVVRELPAAVGTQVDSDQLLAVVTV
jgi:acetyl/propionyl-CoA carboxylase alpha subunit